MRALLYLRLSGLIAGAAVYLALIGLILGRRGSRTLERLVFLLTVALAFIYVGGLLEVRARIEYAFVPDATRLVYSLLIVAGVLFVPALMVHAHLQFYDMAAPATVPRWAKVLVLIPLYVAPAISFIVPFFAARPRARFGVRFGPRFGPLDQVVPRLVRLFFWTPEATFIFVAILLSLAIDLGILSLKEKMSGAERRFFKWMAGISSAVLGLLLATQLYRHFETQQIEALSVAMIAVSVLPGAVFGYYAVRHNLLDLGRAGSAIWERKP